MGFRDGAYATVWEVSPKTDAVTRVRISISRKNKETGEYTTDFSGWCVFLGTSAASRALSLKEKDRIQIKSCDVSNTYDKETERLFHDYKVFDFEAADGFSSQQKASDQGSMNEPDLPEAFEDDLPF